MEKPKKSKTDFQSFPAPLDEVAKFVSDHTASESGKSNPIQTLIIRCILFLMGKLSWKAAYNLGGFIGKLLYRFSIRRDIAMVNLEIAFGKTKTVKEREEIYRKSMLNFGRVIVNYLRLPFMGENFWTNHCDIVNERALQNAMNRKKGVLLLAAHYGMWDLAGGKVGMSGYPVSVVAKKIMNPAVNKVVINARQSMNFGTIANKRTMERIFDGLSKGEAVAMALDQNMMLSRGVFIDWMGREASSVKSAAYVVHKTGAPVLTGYLVQEGPDRFKLVMGDELKWVDHPEDVDEEIKINTQIQSYAVQQFILEKPELWFWIHKRWKIQPEGVLSPYK
jgi:KDO2-lipid IV(A) lauroyltransferase